MIPMSFMKQSADLQPIEDTVFAVVSMAKQDIAEHGADAVVDATIGSLYDEQGKLVAYQNVFDHYNATRHEGLPKSPHNHRNRRHSKHPSMTIRGAERPQPHTARRQEPLRQPHPRPPENA